MYSKVRRGKKYISRLCEFIRVEYQKIPVSLIPAKRGFYGENRETDATKIPEYNMLAKVYTVPSDGVLIPREDFSDKNADELFKQWKNLSDKQLLLLLERNREKIEHRAKRLKKFAEVCRNDTSGFVITHGDAGGNLLW